MKMIPIEELNNQYSIREDGVIIRHYHINPKTSKIHFKDKELQNRASTSLEVWLGKSKKYRINTLLRKYFNTYCCSNCKQIFSADNSVITICNKCLEHQKINSIILPNTRKFIENTNNQYSIGIDGSVIRHFYKANAHTILVKDDLIEGHISKNALKVEFSINTKCVGYLVKHLVAEYFNLPKPFINNNRSQSKIININGNSRNCDINNLKWVVKQGIPTFKSSEERREYYININKEYSKSEIGKLSKKLSTQRVRSTPEGLARLRLAGLKTQRIYQDTLNKNYIAGILKIPTALLTNEVYESHKALLKVKRLLSIKEGISVYSFNNLKL